MQYRDYNLNAFNACLSNLRGMVEAAKPLPIGNGCIIDRKKLAEELQKLSDSLPSALKDCEIIISNEKSIIDTAKKEAEAIRNNEMATAQKYRDNVKAMVEQLKAQNTKEATDLLISAKQQAGDLVSEAQRNATEMVQEATDRAKAIIEEAQQKADQLVSEQEILVRAQAEAEALKQSTDQKVEEIYSKLYEHVDGVLAQLEQSISEKLTDIKLTRQQVDENFN